MSTFISSKKASLVWKLTSNKRPTLSKDIRCSLNDKSLDDIDKKLYNIYNVEDRISKWLKKSGRKNRNIKYEPIQK